MTERIAFCCLGTMGGPMAGHLAESGLPVTVWNRTREPAERWVAAHGGTLADSPAEAAQSADVCFVCTGADEALEEVVLGAEGVMAGLAAGGLLVDHTTASARIAERIAQRAAAQGVGFLDAPVSGGEVGAQRGTLTVMCGGREEDFARARPLLARYARHAARLGPAGAGQRAKMVNQICIAGLVQALSEGLAFAERVGLDPGRVVDVISHGAAQSWQMDHRASTMIEDRFDFGFAVDWMRKDLALALEEARRTGAHLPVAALVDQLYAAVQARGGGRLDTSSLITLLRTP